MKIQLKRSNVLDSGSAKEPTTAQMEYGELAINYESTDPTLFYKDSANAIRNVKLGILPDLSNSSAQSGTLDDRYLNLAGGTLTGDLTGTNFIGGVCRVSSSPPTATAPGELWYNTDDGRTYVYYTDGDNDSQWVDAAPDTFALTNNFYDKTSSDARYLQVGGDTATGVINFTAAGTAIATTTGVNVGVDTTNYDQGVRIEPIVNNTEESGLISIYFNQAAESAGAGVFQVVDGGNADVTTRIYANGTAEFVGQVSTSNLFESSRALGTDICFQGKTGASVTSSITAAGLGTFNGGLSTTSTATVESRVFAGTGLTSSNAIVGLSVGPNNEHIFYTDGSATHASNISVTGDIYCDGDGTNDFVTIAANDGAIEISREGGGAYIDFKNDLGDDYDVRISNPNGTSQLNLEGNFYAISDIGTDGVFITNRTSVNTAALQVYGQSSSSDYNYILAAENDTGNACVHFINGSTRTSDGGANGYTIRNDIGPLNLGNASQATALLGSGDLTFNSNEVWHAGNDGSGSGLDADTVDGIQASSFLRSDSADTFTQKITGNVSSNPQEAFDLATNDNYANMRVIQNRTTSGSNADGMYIGYQNGNSGYTRVFGGGATSGGIEIRGSGTTDVKISGNTAWHAGNDGAGSGLDADNLDGYTWASSGKTVRASSFYADDWFRNYNSGEGMYNETDGTHWYSYAANGFTLRTGTTSSSIRLQTSGSATRGYIYASNSNEFGFLNTGGQWSLKNLSADGNSPNLYFMEEGNETWTGNPGNDTGKIEYHSNRFYIVSGSNSAEICKFRHSGTDRGSISNSGDLTMSGNVTAYSDITLKENIEVIANALDKVSEIRGVTYDRKDIEEMPRQAGVIAQEVEAVLPEVVSTDENGIKSVAYGNLVGLLIEAVKELKAEVETLKAERN